MTAVEHLEELRLRLVTALLAWAVGTLAALPFADDLLAALARPLPGLYVTSPAEAFVTHLRLAVYAGAVLAAPVALYQAIAFVLPALTPGERRVLLWSLPGTAALFVLGAGFGYAVVLPLLVRFLLGFATGPLRPLITAGNYLSFVAGAVLPFGLAFQLPAVVLLLGRLGLVTAAGLARWRRHAVVAALAAGAALTPTTDAVSQLLLAGPLWLLYEASTLLLAAAEHRRARRGAAPDAPGASGPRGRRDVD